MIIFDLDGTLANCEHRRHFVDPERSVNHIKGSEGKYFNVFTKEIWKPDWKSFYDDCDKDTPIIPVWRMFVDRLDMGLIKNIQIWSGRCESSREKTEAWLMRNLSPIGKCKLPMIKMRPIGDSTPDDQLKERWLDEYLADMWPRLPKVTQDNEGTVYRRKDPMEYVFDDRPKVVRMWRRRGIFVFNCCQHDEDF